MKWLFAIDVTEAFDPVFAEAVAWARRFGATLDLVYVGAYDDIYEFVTDPHVRKLLAAETEALRARHEQVLGELLDRVPEAHRGAFHLASGSPAAAIVALEGAYDAVVVATHGRTGLSQLWLGSVAERVVRTSRKPVIVLRVPAPAA